MRQTFTVYEQDLDLIAALQRQVKRALQKMAFSIREGTADQQLLYSAIFSNQTRFGLEEATLLAYHFSWGANDLSVLRYEATDANIQICVDAIQAQLITMQKDSARSVVGLS